MFTDREIPATMATQHPDNAGPAYWCGKAFISSLDEIEECYRCYSDLGVGEYMWDWEGKFVDEAVVDKLYHNYYEYFRKNPLGKKKYLTFRIPNVWEERGHRLARAFMSILTAEDFARDLKFHTPPLFEVILPMSTNVKQLLYIHEAFRKAADLKRIAFGQKTRSMSWIDVIPLIETADGMLSARKLGEAYIQAIKKEYGKKPRNLRIFIARSDPALNAGLIPAVMAAKVVMPQLRLIEKNTGVKIYTWLGGGSLPFRGRISPENYENIARGYYGLSSITIQSAFRYDYPLDQVKKAIKYFNHNLPRNRGECLDLNDAHLNEIRHLFSGMKRIYQGTVEKIADTINMLAAKLPRRRERLVHVGLFGYGRGVGKVSLPRAIRFTGALYSLGVPPEFIGTGRALRLLVKNGHEPLFKLLYRSFESDILFAGHYLNRENLDLLARKNPAWNEIKSDIAFVEEYIGHKLGPVEADHVIHRNLVSTVYHKLKSKQDPTEELMQAAVIRKSIG